MRDSIIKSCPQCTRWLGDYVDGALSAEDRRAMDAHLAAHPECKKSLDLYQDLPKRVRDATDVAMPALVRARLRRRIRRDKSQK